MLPATIQHDDQSWVRACAWVNRDVWTHPVSRDTPDEIWIGLHRADQEPILDDLFGVIVEWQLDKDQYPVGVQLRVEACEWWTLPHLSDLLQYLAVCPPKPLLTPLQLLDFLVTVGYTDCTEYGEGAAQQGSVTRTD